MLLRQTFNGGIRDYPVESMVLAQSIVALLNIAYSYTKERALSENLNINEALFTVATEHELYGVPRDMLKSFGDCIFTLVMSNGDEWIMNPDFIQFEKVV